MSDVHFTSAVVRPRILLVDDAELNREIFGGILTAADYDVDLADDGESACAATWTKPYDLVLMDIEMPGMNGFEAAARIRAREGVMSGVKIAALTATAQPDAATYAFWSGIDAFIAKPIDPSLLVSKVGDLVGAAASNPNDWKPVWRLGAFAKYTERLDDEEAADYLCDFSALLDATEAGIHAKRSDVGNLSSSSVLHTVHSLRNASTLFGFEEIAGVCARYEAAAGQADARCLDPNLLGAIERARYAIDVFRRERHATPVSDWWGRTRVNVQNLFRGVMPT